MKFPRWCSSCARSLKTSKSRVGQERQWLWERFSKEKKNGIDGLAEMLKRLIENFMRKKRKQLINSGWGHSKCKLEINVK